MRYNFCMKFLKDVYCFTEFIYSESQYSACPTLFVIAFRSRCGMEWGKSCSGESRIFFQPCLSRLFRSFMVSGVGSLLTTSSIMLQKFSTGLISGEFRGQQVFSIKFGRVLLHHAWVALAACAGFPSWTNVMWRLELNSFRLSAASFTFLR